MEVETGAVLQIRAAILVSFVEGTWQTVRLMSPPVLGGEVGVVTAEPVAAREGLDWLQNIGFLISCTQDTLRIPMKAGRGFRRDAVRVPREAGHGSDAKLEAK